MKKIVVANWKMNPDTPREAKALIAVTRTTAKSLKKTNIILCPPAPYLPLFKSSPKVELGSQDIATELRGAYTGSIGAPMVKYSGATYTIIGHSERRHPKSGSGETDEVVNQKVKLALGQGLRVILCVGERVRDEHGAYLTELRTSLEKSIGRLPRSAAAKLIIAYEPVWAIGGSASRADTPADFLEQSIFIRKVLSHWCGRNEAMRLPILYGGSVNPKNVLGFITEGQADGFLVGHESLAPDHWREIMRIVDHA